MPCGGHGLAGLKLSPCICNMPGPLVEMKYLGKLGGVYYIPYLQVYPESTFEKTHQGILIHAEEVD